MSLIGAFIVPHPPLIIPEVGRGQEKEIQKTIDAYKEVARRIKKLKPDTIIVITPHSVMYSDYLHISPGNHANGNFGEFCAPGVSLEVDYDSVFAQRLTDIAEDAGIAAGTLGEKKKALDHATLVPLYFVNQDYQNYKLVRISISGLSPITHYRFGKCIAAAAQETEKRIVMIASGDLSHKLKASGPYGLSKEGPIFDRKLTEAMAKADFLGFLSLKTDFCEAAAECGLRSFITMAGALDGKLVVSELLSYEGPFGVGYAVAAFTITGEDKNRHFDLIFEKKEQAHLELLKEDDEYVRLARQSLEHYIKKHQVIHRPEGLSDELINQKSGVFVSLKINDKLRGCIGTISPATASIADEIIYNAVSAGIKDPRFDSVKKEELPWIVYSVDVLGEAEPISSMKELDVKRYGVIVSSKLKYGLLLPNLKGIDMPQQQVAIALQKAGISKNENYAMARFEVVRHK
jgi:AmmeMemoRadiSam system protein A/AmmeMemoRadiSam system protein B